MELRTAFAVQIRAVIAAMHCNRNRETYLSKYDLKKDLY